LGFPCLFEFGVAGRRCLIDGGRRLGHLLERAVCLFLLLMYIPDFLFVQGGAGRLVSIYSVQAPDAGVF
jgi:hypothetical protein